MAAPPATPESPAASGSAAPGAPTDDSNCADEAVFCIGLVTDTGKVDDKSFNQSAHEGALAAAEQTKGFYKYIETQNAKEYAANMAQFTNKKYDAIVKVGFHMTDATLEAAKANPRHPLHRRRPGLRPGCGLRQERHRGLIFPEDQAGYGGSYLAGLMTKTNKATSQVLGLEIPLGPEVRQGLRGRREGREPRDHRRHHRVPPRRRQRLQRPGGGRWRGQEAARPGCGHHLRRRWRRR